MKEAIDFANWIGYKGYIRISQSVEKWFKESLSGLMWIANSTEELYQIYLNEKK